MTITAGCPKILKGWWIVLVLSFLLGDGLQPPHTPAFVSAVRVGMPSPRVMGILEAPPAPVLTGLPGAAFHVVWQIGCSNPPAKAVTALDYATTIWESLLASPITIDVSACWTDPLPCTGIACGEPVTRIRNFTGTPFADTYYPVALANALGGVDLTPNNSPDINIWFDSAQTWSYVTSGTPDLGIDFVTVALHELAHGLGFEGNMYESYNVGFCGNGPYYWYLCPTIFDRLVVDSQNTPLLNYLTPDPRVLGTRLKTDANFGGPNTILHYGTPAKLNTPATWNQGSSLSHLDPATFGSLSTLMQPANLTPVRSPDSVVLGILQDLGWQRAGAQPNLTSSGPLAVGVNTDAAFQVNLAGDTFNGQPITYTWTAAGQSVVQHPASGANDNLTLQWPTSGMKTLRISAVGNGISTGTARSVLVFSLAAAGPSTGQAHQSNTFQVTLSPTTSLPITYQWQASGQSLVTHPNLGSTDSLQITWNQAGDETITVTANIGTASTQTIHAVHINSSSAGYSLYLPVLSKTP